MARSRRRIVSQGSAEPPTPDEPTSAVDAAPAPEPEPAADPEPKPEPKPEPASKPKRKARRDLGGQYETIAHVRFTDREVPPGTPLTLTDAEARRLMKIGAVRAMED